MNEQLIVPAQSLKSKAETATASTKAKTDTASAANEYR